MPSRIIEGECPSQQAIESINVDILQFLFSEFGVHPLGLAQSYAAESCDQVAEASPGSPSGMYWIKSAGTAAQVYCRF